MLNSEVIQLNHREEIKNLTKKILNCLVFICGGSSNDFQVTILNSINQFVDETETSVTKTIQVKVVTNIVKYKNNIKLSDGRAKSVLNELAKPGIAKDRMTSKVGLLSGGQRQALTLLMAALMKPKLLLLDEHTAALDPATAAKVLQTTDHLIEENQFTTLMITHNMKDAIEHGNRLIMMNEGRIIYDVSGEEKQKLTREDLLQKFSDIL